MKKEILLFISLTLGTSLNAQEVDSIFLGDGSELKLYGVASLSNLDEEIYLGGIYLPEFASSVKVLTSKRLEMRIATDRLSSRRFSRLWLDAITLNSTRAVRNENLEQIQQFSNLFQGNLLLGDHVSFDFIKEEDKTTILLNGVKLGDIAGKPFFDLLLNCWVGDTPPSKEFKIGVMAQAEESRLTEDKNKYSLLSFSSERFVQIQNLFDDNLEIERLAELERQAEIIKLLEETRQDEQARQNALVAEQSRLAEAEEKERLRLAEEQARIDAEKLALIEAEEKIKFDEEQLQLVLQHQKTLSDWISQKLVYPERALTRGLEGKIKLTIITSRDGGLREVKIDQGSGSKLLDDAALGTVNSSIPLPAMPVSLIGETFSFLMPINYILD